MSRTGRDSLLANGLRLSRGHIIAIREISARSEIPVGFER